jgi:predicted enzyme related to lactoylglutathione lyase
MFYSFLKSFVFFIAYYKKMSLNSDKILLFISFIFLIYIYFHINKIETYQDPMITRIIEDLMKVDPRVKDLHFEASNESFTEDKKRVYLCLKDENGNDCITQWSPFQEDTKYFDPSKKEFMQNFRVHDLEKLMIDLKKAGVTIVGEMETYSYGKFAWILDPEENKIELWEPIDKVFL